MGAGISSRLAQTLRIQKGYTYGAYSYIERRGYTGAFVARTQVRANVTLESMQILKDLIGNYASTFHEEDLAVSKNLISKGYSRRFETVGQLLRVLQTISSFDLPANYMEQQQQMVEGMTLEQLRGLANKHMNEQQMIYVVVGDAKTQLENVKKFGYGDPVMLDIKGNRL